MCCSACCGKYLLRRVRAGLSGADVRLRPHLLGLPMPLRMRPGRRNPLRGSHAAKGASDPANDGGFWFYVSCRHHGGGAVAVTTCTLARIGDVSCRCMVGAIMVHHRSSWRRSATRWTFCPAVGPPGKNVSGVPGRRSSRSASSGPGLGSGHVPGPRGEFVLGLPELRLGACGRWAMSGYGPCASSSSGTAGTRHHRGADDRPGCFVSSSLGSTCWGPLEAPPAQPAIFCRTPCRGGPA